MRPFVALLLLPLVAFAQKDKSNPLDKIDGYKRHTVEGFTLLVSDDVAKADVSKFDRKPLEVLELELKMVIRMMTARQVDALRLLPVWVEWDEQTKLGNGRAGSALATYFGGHQGQMLSEGKHPLKAKTVTVHLMKSLTAEHQPKTDSGRCVLLHEFAHAVHDQVVGADSAAVKEAYTQAMERKLYDKAQYVSTNEFEYFAELTCAYFDQLHHFPKTRGDLKKHDPVSFRLMEGVWGKDKKGAEGKGGPLADTGADKFDLAVRHADLQFGEPLAGGPKLTRDDLKGRVAVLTHFAADDYPVLTKLADLHRELSAYGLFAAAGSARVVPAEELKKELTARQVPFPTTAAIFVRDKDSAPQFTTRKSAHTLVFDADGQCVFRGSGHDAAPHARAAVGRALAAKYLPADGPKALKPISDALTGGAPLLDVLPKLSPLAASKDEETAAPAKELLAALTAPGQQTLDDAKKLTKADPLGAYLLLEGQAARYKGCPLADKLAAAAEQARGTPAVAAELNARKALEPIKKLDALILAQPGGFDPTEAKFQAKYAASIAELRDAVAALKKKHPTAKATEQAEVIAKRYGK